jgi:hypothetical protein
MLAMANGQCPAPCPQAPQLVECNAETELMCSDVDEWWCWHGDYCIEAQTGDCPNFCPITWCASLGGGDPTAEEVVCNYPPDPATGCVTESYCELASVGCSDQFSACPDPTAPSECDWETETSCLIFDVDGEGCYLGDFCMPLYTGECPNICPADCMANEVMCANPPDDTGCDTGSYCESEAYGCPVECPDPPASPECDWGTVPCPMIDEDGCYLGDFCFYIGATCFPYCPENCMSDQVMCEYARDYTEAACGNGYYCENASVVPSCSVECPDPPAYLQCDLGNEYSCETIDENGCHNGDFCLPMQIGECYPECPLICPVGEISCSHGVDENGCDLGSYCFPLRLL